MKQINSISDLRILKKIGSGKTSDVFSAQDYEGNIYALKQLRQKEGDFSASNIKSERRTNINLSSEATFLNQIGTHSHIPKVHFYDETRMVLDLNENGELFDYISNDQQLFDEDLARYYFSQMIAVLDFLQSKSVAHRDIKPENIMVDENFDLKLCDFGHATFQNEGEKLHQPIGTDAYMAPELLKGRSYDGFKTDIFAVGVVLFCMINGFPPYFKKATSSDPYYRFFREKRTQIYWYSLQQKFNRTYSQGFMDLITSMLAYKPSERPEIHELKSHPWMNEKPIISREEAIQRMKEIQQTLNNNKSL